MENTTPTFSTLLRTKIEKKITTYLTIGRQDNNVRPFTVDETKKFIEENNAKIDRVIQNILTEHTDVNEVYHLLESPMTDWIGAYLYGEIDIPFE
jgi:hypothetical protein